MYVRPNDNKSVTCAFVGARCCPLGWRETNNKCANDFWSRPHIYTSLDYSAIRKSHKCRNHYRLVFLSHSIFLPSICESAALIYSNCRCRWPHWNISAVLYCVSRCSLASGVAHSAVTHRTSSTLGTSHSRSSSSNSSQSYASERQARRRYLPIRTKRRGASNTKQLLPE